MWFDGNLCILCCRDSRNSSPPVLPTGDHCPSPLYLCRIDRDWLQPIGAYSLMVGVWGPARPRDDTSQALAFQGISSRGVLHLHQYLCCIKRAVEYLCCIKRAVEYLCCIKRAVEYLCCIKQAVEYSLRTHWWGKVSLTCYVVQQTAHNFTPLFISLFQ